MDTGIEASNISDRLAQADFGMRSDCSVQSVLMWVCTTVL